MLNLKYNMGFVANNVYDEIGITRMLELKGFKWCKKGTAIFAYGIDSEARNIIEDKANKFWGF